MCVLQLACASEDAAAPANEPSGGHSHGADASSGACESLSTQPLAGPGIEVGLLLPAAPFPQSDALALQHAAALAEDELNALGGVPVGGDGRRLPLSLLVCDDASPLTAAARLLREEHVSALISATSSDSVVELAQKLSVEAGALLVSSTAQASSLSDLPDLGLVYQMAPSDAQRAPVLRALLERLVMRLERERSARPLRVALASPAPALETAVRDALSHVKLGGRSLSDAINPADAARIDGYATLSAARALVDRYRELAPDIIVLLGGPESVSDILAPLEAHWPPDAARPHYLLTDGAKRQELLELVTNAPELATRLHGAGAVPAEQAQPVQQRFVRSYERRFSGEHASDPALAQMYDAVYALALAAAGAGQWPASGSDFAAGLTRASTRSQQTEVNSPELASALVQLRDGTQEIVGSMAPITFDADGAVASAPVESWCVTAADGGARFLGSGLRVDTSDSQLTGDYQPCAGTPDPPKATSEPSTTTPAQPMAPATAPPAPPTAPPEAPAADPPPPAMSGTALQADVGTQPIRVQIHTDSSWEDGHCDTLQVQNQADHDLLWSFHLRLDGKLQKYWSCNVDQTARGLLFRGVDFNQTLHPGDSAWLGYCVMRDP